MEKIHASGRRKKSIARLFISKGKSVININSKSFKEYFPTAISQFKLLQPLILTNNLDQYTININVVGGGVNGQVEAIRLALAKALCILNE